MAEKIDVKTHRGQPKEMGTNQKNTAEISEKTTMLRCSVEGNNA